jgi:hypothetical protein
MKKVLFGALLVTLAAATPALAQGGGVYADRPVHLNIGGGFTVPMSDISERPDGSKRFGTGGNFSIGMIVEPKPAVGIQFEYGYNSLDGEDFPISLAANPVAAVLTNGIIESHHSMHYLNVNGIFSTGRESKFNAYGVGGGGMYYRTLSLTSPDVGYTTYCDPYWGVCYPTLTSIDQVIGDRSDWDPGVNFGGGVSFALGSEAVFYVETRWHYMWGPEFTDGDGVVRNANGQYLPVTFGFRF